MSKKGIKRREFVCRAGQAVAGAALGGILTRGGLAAAGTKADTSKILNSTIMPRWATGLSAAQAS